MNVEIGAKATQFPEKEYINGIAVAVCLIPLCAKIINNLLQMRTMFDTYLL